MKVQQYNSLYQSEVITLTSVLDHIQNLLCCVSPAKFVILDDNIENCSTKFG